MAKEKESTPVWEWIVAGVGLILVVGAIGTMLYRALSDERTPPNLALNAKSVTQSGNGFLVQFSVTNTGNQTAGGLTVEGVLKTGEETVETSTTTFTYVPANSVREGGLFFTRNPNEFNLQIRALGYEKP